MIDLETMAVFPAGKLATNLARDPLAVDHEDWHVFSHDIDSSKHLRIMDLFLFSVFFCWKIAISIAIHHFYHMWAKTVGTTWGISSHITWNHDHRPRLSVSPRGVAVRRVLLGHGQCREHARLGAAQLPGTGAMGTLWARLVGPGVGWMANDA